SSGSYSSLASLSSSDDFEIGSTYLLLHLARRHHKRLKGRLSERGADRNIGSVTTPGDQDTADPRNVVARVERVPAPADECLEPGAEIHRSRIRGHTDIS